MNEQAKSSHPVPINETVRTHDDTPILPVHRYCWGGLLHWFRATLVREDAIDPSLGPFEVVDNPREVVDAIFKYYEHRGFGLSAEEQEILLHL